MMVYNDDFIPDVMGLQNTGVICYLNSMMQVFFSCSALNQYMFENKQKFLEAAHKGQPLGLMYIKLLEENGIMWNGQNVTRVKDQAFTVRQGTVVPILREIIASRRRNNSSSNLLHHQQECYHEGLTYFIEALSEIDSAIEDLFSIRYKMNVHCKVCKKSKEGPQEKPNFYFALFEEDPILQGCLDSKVRIEDYIKRHVHIPEDYKCENCNAVNAVITDESGTKTINPNIQQIYRLARISSIIILIFNKYDEKKMKYFPNALDFTSKEGSHLHYELISQVEHYGTMRGGHYLTKCRRPTPKMLGAHIQNAQNANSKSDLEALIHRKGLIQKKITLQESTRGIAEEQLLKGLKQVNERIKQINESMKEPPDLEPNVVFHLNDTSVSLDPNGCRPTPNTYIAVYHLV
jgi:ubiquitin C-terminal hydrolase